MLDGRLKLRHLTLVDAVTEHGSLVAAASHLHVTQPVLTRNLKELEDLLDVPLFERGPRGLTPTMYGEAFTEHARIVLAQLTAAERHVAELAQAGLGTVRVGTHLAGSNVLLPRAVARFKAERPNVTVIIREADPESLLVDLEAGRVDFIVGRIAGTDGRRVRQRSLYDEPIRLVTRRGHPAQRRRRLELADLIDYPWVLPGPQTALRGELERVFVRHELSLPANRIECTSILTLHGLLAETDVIAALPVLIATDDPGLALLPISLEPMSHTVGVTSPMVREPAPATRALLSHLDAVAADLRAAMA